MNYFRITLVLGSIFILVYISTIGIKNIVRYNRISLEYNNLNNEYTSVVKKKDFFKVQILNLKENNYLELLVKQKLGYIKKNERVIKFIQE